MARLSSSEQETYHKNGLVVPDFRFSKQERISISRLLDATLEAMPGQRPESIVCPHIAEWNGMPKDLAKQWLDLSITSEILDMAEELIGPDIILWGSQIFCKPAHTGLSISWHQDGHFWPIRPLATLTVWLAIEDVTRKNGCMRYIPGSHQERKLYPHVQVEGDGELFNDTVDPAYYDENRAEDDILDAGQISLHDVYLVHGSQANRSEQRRAAYAWRMLPASSLWDRSVPVDEAGASNFYQTNFAERPIYLVRGNSGENQGSLLIDLRK